MATATAVTEAGESEFSPTDPVVAELAVLLARLGQLAVEPTETADAACLRDGEPPARSRPAASVATLPADLVHLLISRVGLPEAEVAAMSKEEAVARIQRYWTEGG